MREGRPWRVGARGGVLLAAGGFEHNQEMRERYLPKPTSTQGQVLFLVGKWAFDERVGSGA